MSENQKILKMNANVNDKFMGDNESDGQEFTASHVCVCNEKIKGEDQEAWLPIKGFTKQNKNRNTENIFKAECMY